MIHRWELRWRRLRRWFSPADWLAWRLGSPGDSAAGDEPGLVLVQIKGLSRAELEWHLGEGRIPFLQQLLAREKYRLRRLEPERHATIPGPAAEPFHDLGGTIRQGQDFWKGGTLSAQVDAARGLPMVRLTFAGYDQQSRRHGLESYRARAALRRIDRSIRHVWNAAQRSLAREYDVLDLFRIWLAVCDGY